MKRSVQSGKPFYAYVPFTLVHFPTLLNPKFAGKTGNGDAIDELVSATTPLSSSRATTAPRSPGRGRAHPFRGAVLLHAHGNFLRTPFIIRWPGRIPADRVSNEIGHEVDTYTTFAKIAGATVPLDRPIDGVDRSDLILNLRPAESPNETAHATRDSSSSSSSSVLLDPLHSNQERDQHEGREEFKGSSTAKW